MKISNSKKQLAKIIHENGGWRDGYDFAAQDGDDYAVWFYDGRPVPGSGRWWKAYGRAHRGIEDVAKLPNWHQTILSREEYFHLYPAPDADGWIEWRGGECPVAKGAPIAIRHRDWSEFTETFALGYWNARWRHEGMAGDVVAYRLRTAEPEKSATAGNADADLACKEAPVLAVEAKPTIEQLAADYRNLLDFARRKQEEADDAKADASAKLAELVAAGKAHGLALSVADAVSVEPEPELVITDWLDLQAGDVISVSGKWWEPDSEYAVDENDGSRDAPIRVGGYWALIGECSFKFIRRP